ncbi:hypothetical protein T484DRAFT_1807966 [Baffinella frigidus]|nr:hypothetical protein T484DRAFT_1807966 [Cryptophyta sp. CCMP2293]
MAEEGPLLGIQSIPVASGALSWGSNGVHRPSAAKDAFWGCDGQRAPSEEDGGREDGVVQEGTALDEMRDGEGAGRAARRVVGRFYQLRALRHPNLTTYLAVVRSRHNLVTAVSTYPGRSLASILASAPTPGSASREVGVCSEEGVLSVARDVAEALSFLHERGMIHRGLSPACILIVPPRLHPGDDAVAREGGLGRAVLSEFGSFFLTGGGRDALPLLGDARCSSPLRFPPADDSFPHALPSKKFAAPEVLLAALLGDGTA